MMWYDNILKEQIQQIREIWFSSPNIFRRIFLSEVDSKYYFVQTINNLNDLLRIKWSLDYNYDWLSTSIEIEMSDKTINKESIIDIRKAIENLIEQVKNFKYTLYYIDKEDVTMNILSLNKHRNISWAFSDKILFLKIVSEIKQEQQKYLLAISENLKNIISHWISHHQSELQELEKSIEIQANETQTNDWKIALESQKVRLQSYIESINNLVK